MFVALRLGENSDISKCFEDFVSQALGFLKRFYAAELRYYIIFSIIFGIDTAALYLKIGIGQSFYCGKSHMYLAVLYSFI